MDKWFIPFEQFAKLAERLQPFWNTCNVLNLCSAEPFFHKDFFKMVDLVRSYNPRIWPTIITNGMLLNDKTQNELLKRGISNICVSLDGVTKETHEAIRVGSNFDLIIKHVKEFIAKGGRVRTIQVMQKKNKHEITKMPDMCHELGIWSLKYSGINTYRPEHMDECLYSYDGVPEIDAMQIEAWRKCREYKIWIKRRPTKIERVGCGLASTLYIDPNGEMMPCVFFSEPQPFSMLGETRMSEPFSWGNAYTDDIQKAWRSKESWDFRKNIKDREECRLCALGYGVIC